MVVGMEVVHELGNTYFHPLRLIWLQLLLSAQYANNRDQQRAFDSIPFLGVVGGMGWVDKPDSYMVANQLQWTASIMEGAALCSYWGRYFLWI